MWGCSKWVVNFWFLCWLNRVDPPADCIPWANRKLFMSLLLFMGRLLDVRSIDAPMFCCFTSNILFFRSFDVIFMFSSSNIMPTVGSFFLRPSSFRDSDYSASQSSFSAFSSSLTGGIIDLELNGLPDL